VELAVKNMEYKSIDDKKVNFKPSLMKTAFVLRVRRLLMKAPLSSQIPTPKSNHQLPLARWQV
jgi:hypothetical protein